MRHCTAQRIAMVTVKYPHKQAFIRIRDRDAVLSFRPRSVKRHDFGGLSLFPDLETVEQLPKQSSRPATPRVKRRDFGGLSLFQDLETVEQFAKCLRGYSDGCSSQWAKSEEGACGVKGGYASEDVCRFVTNTFQPGAINFRLLYVWMWQDFLIIPFVLSKKMQYSNAMHAQLNIAKRSRNPSTKLHKLDGVN